jgi:hypothetical protein
MSDPKAVLLAAVDSAESGPFDYLLYGGMAAALWGEPRYTEDVDIVLFLAEREAYRFLRSAATRGFAVEEDLAIQQIQISGWARLPFGDRDSPWHLDMTLGDSPFDRSALQRRRQVPIFGRPIWVASPEDLIIYKLVSGRDRDLPDALSVARRQSLDATYLRHWAEWWHDQGVEKILDQVEEVLVSKG